MDWQISHSQMEENQKQKNEDGFHKKRNFYIFLFHLFSLRNLLVGILQLATILCEQFIISKLKKQTIPTLTLFDFIAMYQNPMG